MVYDKEYYFKNKEKYDESSRKWRLKNKEKIKEYKRNYYNSNKDKIIEHIKENKIKQKFKNEFTTKNVIDYFTNES